MGKITALIHTHNDEQRIGRALDSVRACDEVLVIDHGSSDRTRKVARQHGAEVKKGVPGVNPGVYAIDAHYDWVFCLLPNEAVSEALEASLLEWKEQQDAKSKADGEDKNAPAAPSYRVGLRQETAEGWTDLPPETRLVNRKKVNWPEHLPPNDPNSEPLVGDVLRFSNP